MVGGTIFHRDVIQREISRALVLNLSGKTRCSGTAEEIFVLDNAFALIEGQPPRADADPDCRGRLTWNSVQATHKRENGCKMLDVFEVK